MDPLSEFKEKQRAGWSHFAPMEFGTTPAAAQLVRFAGVKAGQKVLDVGCGTGVVALTARREGARVSGVDLTPELLARAKEHSSVHGFEDIQWKEGDVEMLPYADGEFDVVLSQFGHMFAPRPDVATREMLRVLKPGGTIAFSTWPPDHMIGKVFALVGRYAPPPPPGVSPPPQWGDVGIVRERLGAAVRDLTFDRSTLFFPTLSPGHGRALFERTAGPVIGLVRSLQADPAKLQAFRSELESILATYFDPKENVVRQSFLMTRAIKS